MRKHIVIFVGAALILAGAGCSNAPIASLSAPSASGTQTASSHRLDLHGRGLTKVPADIFVRTDLEELDLSGNALIDSLPSQLGHLTKLKVLNVSGNQMTGLPAEVGQLSDLEVLNVSNNKLTGLPMEIGSLRKLREFDVSGNIYSTKDLEDIVARLPKTTVVRRLR